MQQRGLPKFHSQRGVVTLAVGILLLLLITLVTLYGARVGLVEQRISSNEYRSKLVQAAAEAGRGQAIEFLNANLAVFNSDEDVILGNGDTADGWLDPSNDHWNPGVVVTCDSVDNELEEIACDMDLQGTVYFYDAVGDNDTSDDTVLDIFPTDNLEAGRAPVNEASQGNELRVSYNSDYVLCPLDVDDHDNDSTTPPSLPTPPAPPCTSDIEGAQYFAVLIRSEGFLIDSEGSRVDLNPDVAGFQGPRAVSKEIVIKYDFFGAGPAVPLTIASAFSSGGSFEIVANPNGGPSTASGGASGAPFSVWSPDTYDLSGATVTCQRHEFFATDPSANETYYDDASPLSSEIYEVCYQCSCPHKTNESFYTLSSSVVGKRLDIVDEASDFPDDLFKFTFGIPREDYQILKDLAQVIPDDIASCDALDESSSGLIWSEIDCDLQNKIGTPHNPVLLISEGDVRMNANAVIFGVVYVFSPPGVATSPGLSMQGGAQIYGAVVGDSPGSGSASGDHAIIFDKKVLERVSLSPELQRVSPLPGTWSDRETL